MAMLLLDSQALLWLLDDNPRLGPKAWADNPPKFPGDAQGQQTGYRQRES
jgi:hypothetical protein